MTDDDIDQYLSGETLYGDDLELEQIEQWFEDEREGYANLVESRDRKYQYPYHALNRRCGFAKLANKEFTHALGIGSAYGDEVGPLSDSISKITIVEPSNSFVSDKVQGIPATYVCPDLSGILPLEQNSCDLITCFGVLHHIPNVSTVISEFYRVSSPGGFCLIREPIVSMGDWRKPRPRLTKHERGIPRDLFLKMVAEAGFRVESQKYCVFPPFVRLWGKLFSGGVFNSSLGTAIDGILASAFSANYSYHATSTFGKLRPASLYLVLKKPE